MGLMSIYNRSPIWMQNIFTTLQGYKYKKQRYGKYYKQYLKELQSRDQGDFDYMQRYQDEHVKELVSYAYQNSPFYKDFYKNIDISAINTAQDLKHLPVLEKELVRENIERMYTLDKAQGITSNTSGTTGTSMTFVYTKEDQQKRLAYLDYFKLCNGFAAIKMKRASFNSSKIVPPTQTKKIFWRTNAAIKQRIYSGYHCKGDNVKYYVENLNKYKPQSLDGYPSALYEVARYIVDNNIELSFTPIAIFPTAEALLPHYKSMIEQAFKCPVLDQYASSEGAPFVTQCRYGNLHYCMDTGVIETDENDEMMVTCFETHGTPLIRYKVGDRLVFSDDNTPCPCGSCFPKVKSLEGRSLDYLVSKKNGKFTSIYLSLVSEEFKNSVKNMQFVQNSRDKIDIYLVATDAYDDSMDDIIKAKLNYSFGDDMEFVIHKVDEIPKLDSGKYRLIINNLGKDQ